jgi:uncharacterized membrane protein YtjA (UPF0391 family)
VTVGGCACACAGVAENNQPKTQAKAMTRILFSIFFMFFCITLVERKARRMA